MLSMYLKTSDLCSVIKEIYQVLQRVESIMKYDKRMSCIIHSTCTLNAAHKLIYNVMT